MEQQYIDEAARDDAADIAAIKLAFETGKITKEERDYHLTPRDLR